LQVTTTNLSLDYAPLPPREAVAQSLTNLERIAQGNVSSLEVQAEVRSLGNIMNFKPDEPPDPGKAAYAAMALARAGRRTLAAIEAGRPLEPCPLRLSVWRFGATVLACAAAELFAQTGLRLQALYPELTILPVTCLAPLVGYVPDEAALSQGGYEVADAWRFYGQPAPFAANSEQRIINTFKALIAQTGAAT
jgi:hypothetical protein